MSHYKSNLRDIEFNLFEVLQRQDVLGQPPFADLDADTARGILTELERMATAPLAERVIRLARLPGLRSLTVRLLRVADDALH